MENEESLGDREMCMSEDISKKQQLNPSADHFQACQELHDNDPGGGALGYFLGGYVPPGTPNWHPVLKIISPKIDTPF